MEASQPTYQAGCEFTLCPVSLGWGRRTQRGGMNEGAALNWGTLRGLARAVVASGTWRLERAEVWCFH